MLLGLAKTSEGIGAAFSNLVGEVLAEYKGYDSSFLFLSVAAMLPVFIYSFFMPAAVKIEDLDGGEGHMADNLSVASNHGVVQSEYYSTHSNNSSPEIRLRNLFRSSKTSEEL